MPFQGGARDDLGVADLHRIARHRTDPLSYAETVRLGGRLSKDLGIAHVWYPADSVEIVVRGYTGDLPLKTAAVVRRPRRF